MDTLPFGCGGGLAPGRLNPPSIPSSAGNMASPSRLASRLPNRSADVVRAKMHYERMMSLGTGGKALQMSAYSDFKKLDDLEKKKKKKMI